jgi:thiol-disulfide isomerase/thioredoxin
MNKIRVGIVLAIALLIAIYLYQKYRVAPNIKFVELELTDLTGKHVKLEDYKGKTLFLNFFATWCGPCVGEIPSLEQAAEILLPDNFQFICISDEPVSLLSRFSGRANLQHIIILHSVKKLHDLKVFTVPTNYMVNNRGEVIFEKIGDQNWADAAIIEQLKQKAIQP